VGCEVGTLPRVVDSMSDTSRLQFFADGKHIDSALNAQLDTFFLFEVATGKALYWNRAFRDTSGYTDDEIRELPAPITYYSPEDVARATPFIQNVLQEGSGTITLDLICKDGRKVPTEYRVSVIPDDDGESKYLISIGRDISERKQVAAQIRSVSRFPSENPNPVLRVAADGEILYANHGAASLLSTWKKNGRLVLPDAYCGLVAKSLSSGERMAVEVFCEDRYLTLMISPIPEAGYANIYGLDITARRNAEQTLIDSEQRFRGLFDTVNNGVAIYRAVDDGDDFVFVAINRAGCEMDGVSQENLVGMRVTEAFPGFGSFGLLDLFRDVWKTGESRHLPVTRYQDGAGSVWRENWVYRLPSGEIVAVYTDETEGVKSQEKLRRLASAIDQAAEAIVVTDTDATIQYTNPAFETISGYTQEEAIGLNPRVLQSGKHDSAFYEDLWKTLCSGDTWHGRFVNRRKDGALYEEDAVISPVHDAQGRLINYVAVKRDISKEVALESQLRQAQKLDSMGTLASGVAHEINNLIMGIMGYAELIRDAVGQQSEIVDMADAIMGQTNRVRDIVKNLLHFARAEEPSRRDDVTVSEMVEGAASLIRTVMRHDAIELAIDVPSDLPTVRCNSQQIQQVVMNLLTNSRDALNMKYPQRQRDPNKKITVSGREIELESGRGVRITVEDMGSGLPEHVRERMFDPFFTTKPQDKGTGLGLSISHGIVGEHEGKLHVESEIGQWTRFHIDLPLATSSPVLTKG
jgi:PAS domain S-box-containing protein